MSSIAKRSILLVVAISFYLLVPSVSAQLGPKVYVPEQNGTVTAGEKLEIQFDYPNMGAGAYNLDVDLYEDGGMLKHIMTVVKDYDIPDGTSSGVYIPMTLNTTFTWDVPHGLVVQQDDGTTKPLGIFHMSLTAVVSTPFYPFMELRSRPILLHYSAGATNVPTPLLAVFVLIATILLF